MTLTKAMFYVGKKKVNFQDNTKCALHGHGFYFVGAGFSKVPTELA